MHSGTGGLLPMDKRDEFQPFIRRLPEFSFWLESCKATGVALCATFLPFLDIPVFVPILVIYFMFLTYLLLKQQVMVSACFLLLF